MLRKRKGVSMIDELGRNITYLRAGAIWARRVPLVVRQSSSMPGTARSMGITVED